VPRRKRSVASSRDTMRTARDIGPKSDVGGRVL
jgi:hypothetical protein